MRGRLLHAPVLFADLRYALRMLRRAPVTSLVAIASQRRREIGIRMALGAAPARVIASVTRRGLSIAGLGMLLGLPLAWAMARAVAAALEGLAPVDPRTIAIIVALLAAVAAVASSLPALRAARIRPARVLQSE